MICAPRSLNIFLALLVLSLVSPVHAHPTEKSSSLLSFSPGVHFEYFSSTLDKDTEETLTATIASLALEIRIGDRLSLAGLVGYSFSKFEGLDFRQLPFSIELEAGGIGGLLWGAEGRGILLAGKTFGLDIFGQYISYSGSQKEWEIPGLAVPGTLEGDPSWTRFLAGPVLTYRGWSKISLYLLPCYSNLKGTFKVVETVESLIGEEKKEFSSESRFGLFIGTTVDLTSVIRLSGEVDFSPYSGGMDLGIMLRLLFLL